MSVSCTVSELHLNRAVFRKIERTNPAASIARAACKAGPWSARGNMDFGPCPPPSTARAAACAWCPASPGWFRLNTHLSPGRQICTGARRPVLLWAVARNAPGPKSLRSIPADNTSRMLRLARRIRSTLVTAPEQGSGSFRLVPLDINAACVFLSADFVLRVFTVINPDCELSCPPR